VDIVSGREEVLSRGSIAEAVRASASLPGLFGLTVAGPKRYVDGGVSVNVPAGCLIEQGADFVIASNVVCGPRALEVQRPGGFRGMLRTISPLTRMGDSVRALYMMLHQMGARQASCAQITFSPDLINFLPFEFNRGDAIVAKAREGLPAFITQVQQQYKAFCREARSLA
jgi:predicted acylesterase/phospholipase RssA